MSQPFSSGRRLFLLLAVLFAAPVVGAYLLYFVLPDWAPRGRTNYGQLQAPQPLPPAALADADGNALAPLIGKWTLVYVAHGGCDETCQARLLLGRQWRIALNEKRERVQRVYVDADARRLRGARDTLAASHPDLRWLHDSSGRIAEFFGREAHAYFLLDPRGHWVLSYPYTAGREAEQADFRGMQKDIKKLLRNTPG